MCLNHQCAFSLLEVLVAAAISAIGVLGAMALQLAALRSVQDSAYHSLAVALASEMADHMQASQILQQMPPDLAAIYTDVRLEPDSAVRGQASNHCYGLAAHCSAAEFVRAFSAHWLEHVDTTLPGARVVICRDAAADTSARWNCQDQVDAPFVIKLAWQRKLALPAAGAAATSTPEVVVAVLSYAGVP
ncbi:MULTISPECIES: type IV pilus modification protein PilV [unclassified Undibacterium]|uniref:type IV pilus modification protein PilV n=2 Tax=Pseudomonadota TaxID=1224 RepID=UPI002AC8D4FD|nr:MULTISPECIES: type IV pilus modification protein PilV [unclassified Undibacterium]MEB0141218.1 type IV pilus modification protein PilV [Undibacterium sp. CCC2.1]MEB0174283.1 type IV pilus modification protein PilV [Undibacterium sp. CCC1.1]MEB0178221.1 type IV pilus modification protein PilV [Undibacterium sp. CCC3.4]MEB0217419.1 type IV pilus modification protein PilV [Undibacterium sp. 5I2]WPX42117.1 type IV pilus modification protein PilV [Undibacterium sp. CCC3.4]